MVFERYNMTTVCKKFPSGSCIHSRVAKKIYSIITTALSNSLCPVFNSDFDLVYETDSQGKKSKYLQPDIMICCDRKKIKNNGYYGTPKFIAEILSPSSKSRDKFVKKVIYEKIGVDEYWLVDPIKQELEIFYFENGEFKLVNSYNAEDDKRSENYNLDTKIQLRFFPMIVMTLNDIFGIT